MTKREAHRQTHQKNNLISLGFTADEAEALRRISMTLQRWFERECGTDSGCIERDEATGKTYWLNSMSGRRYPVPDRETGARKRLNAIISARNQRVISASPEQSTIHGCVDHICNVSVLPYIQGDPRGAALYIIRPGDVPEGADVNSYYTRGICVY
jgi:hypothetical protein